MTKSQHRAGRRGSLIAGLLCVSLFFTAASVASAQETRTVEASNGTVVVPANPQRVATLGRATLPFLVLGGQPVAVNEQTDPQLAPLTEEQRAAYEAATVVGASASETDLEALAALQPDLIIVSAPTGDFEQMAAQLNAIAPTVLLGFQTDWNVRLEVLAAATNTTATLEEQKTVWENNVAAFQAKYADLLAETTFAEVNRGSWQPSGVFTLNGAVCTEVARATVGLDIVDIGEGGQERSFEQIGELAEYDVILYPVDHNGDVLADFVPVMETNAWRALPAVAADRAVGVYCNGERGYVFSSQYLDSLDRALATMSANE